MPKGKNTKTASTNAKKTSTKKVTKEVVAPTPVPVKVEAVQQVENQDLSGDKYSTQFSSIITELQQWRSNITAMIANVRSLQRAVEKEVKNSNRRSKKKFQQT